MRVLLVVGWSRSRRGRAPIPRRREPLRRRELNIFPLIGGSSDVGVGIGEVSNWALLEPGHAEPYGWKAENGAFITFKPQAGKLVIPFQDYYVLYTLLDIGPQRRVRLDIRPAVTNESTLLLTASGTPRRCRPATFHRRHPVPACPPDPADRGAESARRTVLPAARERLHAQLAAGPGEQPAGPRPVMGTPEVRALLGSFAPHGVDLIEVGLQYDTRDSAIVTRSGMFHAIKARISPSVADWLPYQYVQLDATAQLFFTPLPRWLSVSWRGVADALVGTPPFYELARFDETPPSAAARRCAGSRPSATTARSRCSRTWRRGASSSRSRC